MKNRTLLILTWSCILFLGSCSVFEGVFKAGYYVGIFVVIAILVIVLFIVSKIRS